MSDRRRCAPNNTSQALFDGQQPTAVLRQARRYQPCICPSTAHAPQPPSPIPLQTPLFPLHIHTHPQVVVVGCLQLLQLLGQVGALQAQVHGTLQARVAVQHDLLRQPAQRLSNVLTGRAGRQAVVRG